MKARDWKAALVGLCCALIAAGYCATEAQAKAKVSAKIPIPHAATSRDKVVPAPKEVHAKLRPLKEDRAELIPFDMSPFPYDGATPGEGAFINVIANGRRGHMSRGGTYWEDTTYSDRRVLLYLPKGFDIRKPAVMVVFFHGNGAILDRDIINRQQVPRQVLQSGLNAILVAPQFAVDAFDSSAGSFWQPGTFRQFLDEATVRLIDLYGDERSRKVFATMPVILVAYSGGYQPAAYVLAGGGADERIKGVFMLDALYGEIDKFADWITRRRDAFFVSTYTGSSQGGNASLRRILSERQVPTLGTLGARIGKGSVMFVAGQPDAIHWDFVTHAFADDPIKEVLLRVNEFAHKPGAVKSAYKPQVAQQQQ